VRVADIVLRLCLALPGAIWSTLVVGRDLVRSRRALRGGVLRCPLGHEVPTEGGTYECESCGFVYGGASASIWRCGNPECGAVTPFVACPVCSLSCRNPYRWGRS